jgi:hypothetical protein
MTVERLPVKLKLARNPGCPICKSPVTREHRPFCSKRCKEIDLGRWFSGTYSIPAVEPPDGSDLEDLIEEAGMTTGYEEKD